MSAVAAMFLTGQAPPTGTVPLYTYRIVRTFPHDPNAFTQGLQFLDGVLYEGTGLNGRSSIRKVQLETGKVLQERAISPELSRRNRMRSIGSGATIR